MRKIKKLEDEIWEVKQHLGFWWGKFTETEREPDFTVSERIRAICDYLKIEIIKTEQPKIKARKLTLKKKEKKYEKKVRTGS